MMFLWQFDLQLKPQQSGFYMLLHGNFLLCNIRKYSRQVPPREVRGDGLAPRLQVIQRYHVNMCLKGNCEVLEMKLKLIILICTILMR